MFSQLCDFFEFSFDYPVGRNSVIAMKPSYSLKMPRFFSVLSNLWGHVLYFHLYVGKLILYILLEIASLTRWITVKGLFV